MDSARCEGVVELEVFFRMVRIIFNFQVGSQSSKGRENGMIEVS